MIKVIAFDCFGVVYHDAFKEFIYMHAAALSKFLVTQPYLGELGFPRYYYELARKMDMGEIDEKIFYNILSYATRIPVREIQSFMNETKSMLNEDLISFIHELRRENLLIALAIVIKRVL